MSPVALSVPEPSVSGCPSSQVERRRKDTPSPVAIGPRTDTLLQSLDQHKRGKPWQRTLPAPSPRFQHQAIEPFESATSGPGPVLAAGFRSERRTIPRRQPLSGHQAFRAAHGSVRSIRPAQAHHRRRARYRVWRLPIRSNVTASSIAAAEPPSQLDGRIRPGKRSRERLRWLGLHPVFPQAKRSGSPFRGRGRPGRRRVRYRASAANASGSGAGIREPAIRMPIPSTVVTSALAECCCKRRSLPGEHDVFRVDGGDMAELASGFAQMIAEMADEQLRIEGIDPRAEKGHEGSLHPSRIHVLHHRKNPQRNRHR